MVTSVLELLLQRTQREEMFPRGPRVEIANQLCCHGNPAGPPATCTFDIGWGCEKEKGEGTRKMGVLGQEKRKQKDKPSLGLSETDGLCLQTSVRPLCTHTVHSEMTEAQA